MIVDGMKKCSKCGEEKVIGEFWIKDSKTNRRDLVCKKCRNEVRSKKRRLLGIPEKKFVKSNKPGFKICSKCKKEKPIEEFHKCKTRPDGLQYICKECRVIIDAKVSIKRKEKYRSEHPIKPIPTHKVCKRCGIDKPLEEFRNDYRLKSGKGACCVLCSRPPKKLYREPISEEGKNNIRLAKLGELNPMYGKRGELCPSWKGGASFLPYCPKFNEELKENVRNFFGNKCVLCKRTKKENNNRRFAVHHVFTEKMACCETKIEEMDAVRKRLPINVASFGESVFTEEEIMYIRMMVPLCTKCHGKQSRKSEQLPYEQTEYRKFFTELILNEYGGCCYSEVK